MRESMEESLDLPVLLNRATVWKSFLSWWRRARKNRSQTSP